MKVRIGIGAGPSSCTPEVLGELADGTERHGFDSLWLPEVLTAPVPDPMVTLAWAGGRSRTLKLGTTALLPGRNVLRLAKQAATLDALSGGRLLLTLVPGIGREPERSAVGGGDRPGARTDEVLPVLRRLWAGESVTYHGVVGDLDDVVLSPLPAQDPLEVWLGGMASTALERCGRLADGWLPALCTPDEAATGREIIAAAAARAGREISDEHFGASIAFTDQPLDPPTAQGIEARARGHRAEDVVPIGLDALRLLLERFIAVGFSKFVVRPVAPPESWEDALGGLASAVGELQT